jgi:type 1 glutamine amidotransferase
MNSFRSVLASARARVVALTLCCLATYPGWSQEASSRAQPLKVLFLTGGGYHDYEKLAPHLTAGIAQKANAHFDVKFGIDLLRDSKFADAYDAVLYDVCFDEVEDEILDHALQTTKAGKPTVMIHCAVHAFRKSPKIHDWEACCGMRSKVHDPFEPFDVRRLDDSSPITKAFPQLWHTPGDELYQTISIDPESHRLLEAKSPKDGRIHTVCWTYQYGRGRVFATTLGHDMKTAAAPEYLQLVANGLLWACAKLQPDGSPAPGYDGHGSK